MSLPLKIINSEDFLGFYKSDRNVEIHLPYLQNVSPSTPKYQKLFSVI